MWLFSSPTSRHAPAWHHWDFCVSLNTAILTRRRFDEESKIKIEFHLCKIPQHCHLNPSPAPFEGKDTDREGLGSTWDQVRTPCVPRPSQPGPLLAEEGPGEAVDHAGCTRPLHPPRKSGSSCCRLRRARGQVSLHISAGFLPWLLLPGTRRDDQRPFRTVTLPALQPWQRLREEVVFSDTGEIGPDLTHCNQPCADRACCVH